MRVSECGTDDQMICLLQRNNKKYLHQILHFHHNIRWNSTNYCLYLVLSRWHNRTTTPSVFRDTLNEILSFSSLSLFTLSTVDTAVTPQRLSIQPVYEINYRYTEMFEPILPFIFPPPRYSYFIISPGNILGVRCFYTTSSENIRRPRVLLDACLIIPVRRIQYCFFGNTSEPVARVLCRRYLHTGLFSNLDFIINNIFYCILICF